MTSAGMDFGDGEEAAVSEVLATEGSVMEAVAEGESVMTSISSSDGGSGSFARRRRTRDA